eukprot:TRINITY_DN15826_c0_g1_i1.p1 TRINITY_DN15826_c0_g1~~TRINITY_DN15826_c0_g1_i1.p1  ORF type:complete len:107 (+),score=23.05 TRINITY_DN15826_c0_g1_i1:1-321(+)
MENKISIIKLDILNELVEIKNWSMEKQDLSGFKLLSLNSNKEFILPDGCSLEPGQCLNIWTGQANESNNKPPNYFWTKSYVWGDQIANAQLFDKEGTLISQGSVKI